MFFVSPRTSVLQLTSWVAKPFVISSFVYHIASNEHWDMARSKARTKNLKWFSFSSSYSFSVFFLHFPRASAAVIEFWTFEAKAAVLKTHNNSSLSTKCKRVFEKFWSSAKSCLPTNDQIEPSQIKSNHSAQSRTLLITHSHAKKQEQPKKTTKLQMSAAYK